MSESKIGENVRVATSLERYENSNEAVVTIKVTTPDGELTVSVEIAPLYHNNARGGKEATAIRITNN